MICFCFLTCNSVLADSHKKSKTILNLLPGTSWQWQLSGDLDTSLNVEMYDIDLFNTSSMTINKLHQKKIIVICYFSAGTWENFRPDKDKYPVTAIGKPMQDWKDENWLDIRQIEILAPIIQARLDLAVEKCCDGVEPDNIDGYTNNTGFPLTYDDQLKFNKWLAKIPVGEKIVECIGVCFLQFNEQGKIKRNEVYFDRTELLSEIYTLKKGT